MAKKTNNKDVYNKKEYRKYYTGSSEAHDLREYHETLPQSERKVKKVIKRKIIHKGPKYIYNISNETVVSLQTYTIIFILFACCLLNLVTFAITTNKKVEITNLTAQIKAAREENEALKSEILENFDEKKVREIAETRLGMSEPKPYQERHINVPPESYVVHYDSGSDNSKKDNWYSGMLNLFGLFE